MLTTNTTDIRWTALNHPRHGGSQDTQDGTHIHTFTYSATHIHATFTPRVCNLICNSGYFCGLVGDINVNLGRRALDACPVLGILLGKLLRLSFPALL